MLILLLFLLDRGQSPAQTAAGPDPKEAPAPAGSGRLIGRVLVAGEFAKPRPLVVYKSRDFCGRFVANETLLVGTKGGLRNAVITLHPLDRVAQAAPERIILDNKKCAFVPHVQVAPVGSELLLKNSDPILHTVHARLGGETLFNVGLPRWREVSKRLDRAGVVRIDCDVLHTWMSAVIVVTETPYFAVTDQSGRFSIEACRWATIEQTSGTKGSTSKPHGSPSRPKARWRSTLFTWSIETSVKLTRAERLSCWFLRSCQT